ncbi:MAG: carboxypeptidase-like regulatory domain-containing protein [Pseudomonadales bacterium]|nr:carboxypeptidase-like regulatory domain-containing protein [Pseudomonadales bacterium]
MLNINLSRLTELRKTSLTLILACVLALGACDSGSPNTDDNINNEDLTAELDQDNDLLDNVADIEGIITDERGRPLAGVSAHLSEGDTDSISNDLGQIAIEVDSDSQNLVIQLSKSGYASQVLRIDQVHPSQTSRFSTSLIKLETAHRFVAEDPVSVFTKDGAYLEIDAHSLIKKNGELATGDIQLHVTPIDVSDALSLAAFPGLFSGIVEEESTDTPIMSYGTVNFEFSQNNELLQLSELANATIELPIYVAKHPDGTDIAVGDQIALWSLEETTGLWSQDGHGDVVDSVGSPTRMALRASVNHFSWWNADVAPETCSIQINTNNTNNDLLEIDGHVLDPDFPRSSSSTSTTQSTVALLQPADMDVQLNFKVTRDNEFLHQSVVAQCNSESDNTIEIELKKQPPRIHNFKIDTLAIFEINNENKNEIIGNDAFVHFRVSGANEANGFLVLSSTEGHNTTLGNDVGSTQFPIQEPNHEQPITFTLTATNEEGTQTRQQNFDYIKAQAPTAEIARLRVDWQQGRMIVELGGIVGADQMNIYSAPVENISLENMRLHYSEDHPTSSVIDIGLDELVQTLADLEGNFIPGEIAVELSNQYGVMEFRFSYVQDEDIVICFEEVQNSICVISEA